MPLGKEVKVMQCFRCKAFGHRTNDRECPLQKQGNILLDSERQAREDPMSRFVAKKLKDRQEKYERVEQLKILVEEIRREEAERKRKKKHKEEKKKSKKSKKS
jgi:retinitis pigmentosa 9 protein